MNSGSDMAFRSVVGIIAGLALLSGPSLALATTPAEACAADSLYLVSPLAIDMHQQVSGRPGLVISWQDLDNNDATCYTLTGLDTLEFSVDVQGGFNDHLDREILFTASGSGSVGQNSGSQLLLSWQSQGDPTNGVLGGYLNLANNGGLLKMDNGGNWLQENQGLPMSWRQTNITALAEGSDGFRLAAFSGGVGLDTDLKGLWGYDGTSWTRIASDVFNSSVLVTRIAISAASNNVFAVGTRRGGLLITQDGGQSFTNFIPPPPELDDDSVIPVPNAGALNWASDRLIVFFPNFGLFVSEDGGNNFDQKTIMVEATLDSIPVIDPNAPPAEPVFQLPGTVNEITVNPSDPDHILLSLTFNGVWESFDGGETWHDLYGDLMVGQLLSRPGAVAGLWIHSAKSAIFDPTDSQVIVMAVSQKGLFRTDDGGETWTLVGENVQPSGISSLNNMYLKNDFGTPGLMYVFEDNWSLLRSTDSGLSWEHNPSQPSLMKGTQLIVSPSGDGTITLGSYGGGIYQPGTSLRFSDTYGSVTSSYLRTLDLGLDITFAAPDSDGEVADIITDGDRFNLVCQTFQGWVVWRSPGHDPENMTMLGIYDRVNPESCIVGYCGDERYEIEPQCYISKRATCFNFDTEDTVRFFDDEVYNGFSYNYAVGTFDYGNMAMTTPQNNTNSMVFSPRYAGDLNSIYPGDSNLSFVQVNSNPADPVDGETIYVYPNPLRNGAGIPGAEGEQVVFTNLPPKSRVRLFTTAGDDVINLGPEMMEGGNIYWRTRNREGEPVSPGVYFFKVESPAREAFWGKLVIIR